MDYRFTDLVDIDAFRSMLQSFYEATGILHGLVDADNNIISATGWQKACTDFHRVNPCSNARCLESNHYLAEHLGEGAFVGYACKNGLMDYATPIIIEGQQLATLYFGQLLHDAPDMVFFRLQAQEYGFDEEAYLDAIRQIPVIPKERVQPIMAFYVQMAQMLAGSGLDRMRQREAEQRIVELNCDLARRVEERTAELEAKNTLLTTEVIERQWTEAALRDSRAHLQALLDSAPIGIGWSNADGNVEYINDKFTEMFGYTLEDIPTVEHWYHLAYPDKAFRSEVIDVWSNQVSIAKKTGSKPPALEVPVVTKDGKIRHVIIAVSWVGNHRLVNFSDINDRWLAEQRNRMRNSTLEMIATGTSMPQVLNAIARSVEEEDTSMICSILLLSRDGRHLLTGAAPSLPAFYNDAVDGLEIGDGVGSCGTAAFREQRVVVEDINSHPYWEKFKELAQQAELASCWSEPVISSKGRLLGTFAIYHRYPCSPNENDLQLIGYAANLASIAIEHHQADAELERQAHTDFLTELANRRYFMELAEAELTRALRYHNAFSLFMFDVDHFKAVNDNYGHKVGDKVLQSLAEILKRSLREVDVVGRLGGEEFAVILPETGADEAWEAAERLRLEIADTEIQAENAVTLKITVSIGVVTLIDESSGVEVLLKQADDALYLAKNSGRNQVCMAYGMLPKYTDKFAANFVKLSWHTDYECGHALIDEQHRMLFRHANDLMAAILARSPAYQLTSMIDVLVRDIDQHFQDEEAIFTASGFPGKEKHIISHRQLADSANQLVKHFREDSLAIGELFQFLVHELIAEHMLKEDREFFVYLRDKKA